MHVKTRKITFLGILLAIAVILVYGGTVIESNTLFFLCAASYCLGVAIHECGKRLGLGFFIAATVLTFFLVPNKMYCVTLAAMNLFILLKECLEEKMPKAFLYVKFIIFNVFYIPALLFAPAFLYTGKLNRYVLIGLWIVGQIGFYVYDYVYCWFMNRIWVDFRKKIL